MTPEEQNIAIAEACGWTVITSDLVGRPPWSDRCGFDDCKIPSYTTDLNAMHEAEKFYVFNKDLDGKAGPNSYTYWSDLLEVVRRSGDGNNHTSATAAQRAEAFLRTIGKWKEPTPRTRPL